MVIPRLIAVSLGITIYLAVHFYKTMYTDEGYLTHTLPVGGRELLWSKLIPMAAWSLLTMLVVVLAAVVLIAVRIIRRTMMTAEEKLALKSAQAEQKVPLRQRGESSKTEEPEFDDGYRSILADDEDDAEEVADYEQTISHSQLHSIGHADAAEPEEKAPEEENESENE